MPIHSTNPASIRPGGPARLHPLPAAAVLSIAALFGTQFLLNSEMLAAQAATTTQAAPATHAAPANQIAPAAPQSKSLTHAPAKTRHAAHKRTSTLHRSAAHHEETAKAVVPVTPPPPPKPNWPADQPPQPATVKWDSSGLEIQASNSSLDQILHEVGADIGVKIQGLDQDQRIFGTYGPGPARDVLSRLLDGSGYNVVMIGGQGDAPPQSVILTKSSPASPQPANQANNNNQEDDSEDVPQQSDFPEPPRPMPIRENPFAGRMQQETQQEMLQRERQLEQQRQAQEDHQQYQSNPQ